MALKAFGSLNHITFVRRRRQNIAEKKPVPVDAESLAQLSWRTMYQKCTALWHTLTTAEKEQWESLARPLHMTGYAYWQSQCLKPNPGIYLPLAGGTMQGNIDMDGNRLLDLIDPTLAQEAATKAYHDANLPSGGYTEGAKAYHNASQTIANTTWTTVAFNSEYYDTDTIHDNTINNSRLTCKTAGKYLVVANMTWAAHNGGYRRVWIKDNTGTIRASAQQQEPTGVGAHMNLVTILELAVNDWIYVSVKHNQGNPTLIQYLAAYGSHFMMQRIG